MNVLKVIVLMGTFALAMAFAGNDLVNFIGVPLTGLASYQDYMANGNGDAAGFLMGSLNGPSNTPLYFLIGAGGIMVAALATSKKARKVAQTEIGLGSHVEIGHHKVRRLLHKPRCRTRLPDSRGHVGAGIDGNARTSQNQ